MIGAGRNPGQLIARRQAAIGDIPAENWHAHNNALLVGICVVSCRPGRNIESFPADLSYHIFTRLITRHSKGTGKELIMSGLKRCALAGLVIGVTVAAGCQGMAKNSSAVDAPSTQAVACSKCKVTYVRVPATGPRARTVRYTTEKRMECPDCRSAAENFFATGKLQHTCKHCGDTLEICESH
jgi:hypothetical protein